VVRVYDAGSTMVGRPYFVMVRVAGEPITLYADGHRLSVEQRLEVFLDVCAAVHHAHQRGVLHRDLKPSNVLVAEHDGRPFPVVIDFGIAKALREEPGASTPRTEIGRRIGTPDYMSPEQLAGSSAPVDIRSDLYSLGVLLYALLTGTLPFERRAVGGVWVAGGAEAPPLAPSARVARDGDPGGAVAAARRSEPRALRRRLRGDLDWILQKTLAAEPDERYAAVSDLAADLRRHLAGRPVEAGPPSALYRARKFLRRHALAATAAGLLALGLLIGVAGLAWGLLEARRARVEAEARRHEAQQTAAFLFELFGGADPYREAEGAEVSLRQILDRGADRVVRELAGQPAVQAALLDRIGNVYFRLDLRERAETLLVRALELRRGLYGERRVEVAESLESLSRLRARLGQTEEAERLARSALELRRRLFGDDDGRLAPALLPLGAALGMRGDFAGARAALARGAELERRAPGEDRALLSGLLRELANAQVLAGDDDAAGATLRELLALAPPGENPLVRATTLERLGVRLTHDGREAEAEPYLREVLELRRRHLPADHGELAAAHGNLGLALHYLRRWEEAEEHYRAALAIDQRRAPGDARSTVARINNLGLLAFDRGEFATAEELFRGALDQQLTRGGDQHPDLAYPATNLGRALQHQGDLAGAEPLFRRSIAVRRRAFPDGHPHLSLSLLGLGEVLTARGELAAAEAALVESLDIRRRTLPAGDWRTAEAASALGACLAARGRAAEAEPLLREGAAGLAARRGADDWRTLLAERRLRDSTPRSAG
jgi:tetratricopeptide (TPR) repeat protein